MIEFIKFSIDFELNQLKNTSNSTTKTIVYRSPSIYIKSPRFTSSLNSIDLVVLTDGSVLISPFSLEKTALNLNKKVIFNFFISRNDIFSKFNKN